MPHFDDLDRTVSLQDQLEETGGPVVLVNVLTVDPADAELLVPVGGRRRC